MADGLESGSMSVFSLAGGSVLGLFENVTISMTNNTVETKPVTRVYGRAQGVKREWSVDTTLMANNALATARIDHLLVTVFTIDGNAQIGQLASGELSMTATIKTKPEVGAEWKTNQVTGKKLMVSGSFNVPTGAASPLIAAMDASTIEDLRVAVTITVDGVTYGSIPMVITSALLKAEREGLYVVDMSLEGESPDTGDFPVAPTGTTTLFEKALNSRAAVAVALTTQTTNGNALSGNAVISAAKADYIRRGHS
jgi:hypothetical protein